MFQMGKKSTKIRSDKREPASIQKPKYDTTKKSDSLEKLKNHLLQAELDGNTTQVKMFKAMLSKILNKK